MKVNEDLQNEWKQLLLLTNDHKNLSNVKKAYEKAKAIHAYDLNRTKAQARADLVLLNAWIRESKATQKPLVKVNGKSPVNQQCQSIGSETLQEMWANPVPVTGTRSGGQPGRGRKSEKPLEPEPAS